MRAIVVKQDPNDRLYRIALGLALLTVLSSIAEGLVSIYFGYEDQSMTLFGFGGDSIIEVISGIGIAHMVIRIRNNTVDRRDDFERTALRVTGFAFYALAVGLTVTSCFGAWTGHRPQTGWWGVVISLISIGMMSALIYGKTRIGKQLNSRAILADAECTRVCIYMSVVLLAASGIFELTKLAYVDSVGTLGLAYISLNEGRECFRNAKNDGNCSSCHDEHSIPANAR